MEFVHQAMDSPGGWWCRRLEPWWTCCGSWMKTDHSEIWSIKLILTDSQQIQSALE